MCLLQWFCVTGYSLSQKAVFQTWLICLLQFYLKELEWQDISLKRHMEAFINHLCWLGHIVPHFSWTDMLWISLVIKWTQSNGLHSWEIHLSLDFVIYIHTPKSSGRCICNIHVWICTHTCAQYMIYMCVYMWTTFSLNTRNILEDSCTNFFI